MASTSCFLHHAPSTPATKVLPSQRNVPSLKPNQLICRAQKDAREKDDADVTVSRRLALTVLIGAAAVGSKVSPADAAYGQAANVFGKPKTDTDFIPVDGDGFKLKVPSKWNPSKEVEYPNQVLRYEDNFDATSNVTVMVSPTDKKSIQDFGSPEEFLSKVNYLLGKQAYFGKTDAEGGFDANVVATANILESETREIGGKQLAANSFIPSILRLSPCSSSSSTISPYPVKHRDWITPASRTGRWVSKICSEIQQRKNDELKSVSNGYPINAASFLDGAGAIPLSEQVLFPDVKNEEATLSITVVGASGDLAKKKIFPALFALFYEDFLPEKFIVFGYARTKMDDEELRNMISRTLTCRIDKRENCNDKMKQFLQRCFYQSGQYDSEEHFAELDRKLKEKEGGRLSNRLFYLSIPPNIFVDVVKCASTKASSSNGWTRVIVEKPFGRDSESSRELTRCLMQYLSEEQIFRIDHYLGKELVENLSVLRFSNLVFEPLWSRNYIRSVQFIFSEDFGTEGRGGYFDNYGIIRDIMQNHLLQILALFAMETPVSLDAEDIRNEKVKVLRSMRSLQLEDVVIGQYKGHSKGDKSYPGYTDDPTVPKDSTTPTFAAAALFIDNARWDGVPFLMKAGKALHTKRAEVRVQFRHVPGNLYKRNFGPDLDKATNELVLRVQPDEAIYLKINNKVPGLGMKLDQSDLNLLYRARYPREIPDAYERLILDAIAGERRLFIRSDELDAAWSLFTPLLKELEDKKIAPELYPYGSRGPVSSHYLAAKYNVRWGDLSGED